MSTKKIILISSLATLATAAPLVGVGTFLALRNKDKSPTNAQHPLNEKQQTHVVSHWYDKLLSSGPIGWNEFLHDPRNAFDKAFIEKAKNAILWSDDFSEATLKSGAFKDVNITKGFHLPTTIKVISQHAFENAKLSASFDLPPSVKVIDAFAFKGAVFETQGTKGFSIPTTVREIHEQAFEGATLPRSFNVPTTTAVQEIYRSTFHNSKYSDGTLFILNNHRLQVTSSTNGQSDNSPAVNNATPFNSMNDLINAIKGFADDSTMKVRVGDTVQIGTRAPFKVTQEKFDELKMKNSYKGSFSSESKRDQFLALNISAPIDLFKGESNLSFISLPKTEVIEARAFRECSSLTKVDLPIVKNIDDNAFALTSVTSYHLPEVRYIGNNAFGGPENAKVTEVYIPRLKTFGDKGTHEDWAPLSGIKNEETTQVTLSYEMANSKDALFGTGNWDQIKFISPDRIPPTVKIRDAGKTILGSDVVIDSQKYDHVFAKLKLTNGKNPMSITDQMVRNAFSFSDVVTGPNLDNSLISVDKSHLSDIGGHIDIIANDIAGNSLKVTLIVITSETKIYDTENDLINVIKRVSGDQSDYITVGDVVQAGNGDPIAVDDQFIAQEKMKNSYKGTFSNDLQRRKFLAITDTVLQWEFRYEYNLTYISLPRVKTINLNAFRNCRKLTKIDLPNVVTISNNAFKDTKVTEISLPELIYMGYEAFGTRSSQKVSVAVLPKLSYFWYDQDNLQSGNAMAGVKNDMASLVTLPASLNSDEAKDRLFGQGNWNDIVFIWL